MLILQWLLVIGITGAFDHGASLQVFHFMTRVDNDSHVVNSVGSDAFLCR